MTECRLYESGKKSVILYMQDCQVLVVQAYEHLPLFPGTVRWNCPTGGNKLDGKNPAGPPVSSERNALRLLHLPHNLDHNTGHPGRRRHDLDAQAALQEWDHWPAPWHSWHSICFHESPMSTGWGYFMT